MGHEPELKFWMKFRMKYWMTGFETFDFFAWFFQYLDIQFQAHAEKLKAACGTAVIDNS